MDLDSPFPPAEIPRRLAHRVLDAAAWVSGSRMVGLSIQALIVIALARLLTPAEFGSYAVGAALATFTALVGQLGLGPAIVRAPELARGQLAGAFWLIIFTGMLGVLVLQMIAEFAFDGQMCWIVRWGACSVMLQHLACVPIAQLQRALRFRDYVIVELAAQLIGSGLVSIVAACCGFGVWSLVVGGLVREAILAGGTLSLTRLACLARIDLAGTAALARNGGALMVARLGANVAQIGPQLIVGYVLGPQALGLFTRAFFTVNRLELAAVSGLQNVLLAAFSSGGQNEARLRAGLLRSTRLLAALVLPLFAFLAIAAEDLVAVVLGAAWRDAAPLIAIACLLGATSALATVADALLKSTGKWRVLVAIQAVSAAGVLLAVWSGSSCGTFGAVLAVTLVGATTNAATVAITLRLFRVRARDYLRILAPAMAFSLILAAAHELVTYVVPAASSPISRLALFGTMSGAVAFGGLLWLRKRYAGRIVGDYGMLADWYRGHRQRLTGG